MTRPQTVETDDVLTDVRSSTAISAKPSQITSRRMLGGPVPAGQFGRPHVWQAEIEVAPPAWRVSLVTVVLALLLVLLVVALVEVTLDAVSLTVPDGMPLTSQQRELIQAAGQPITQVGEPVSSESSDA